MKRVVGIGTLPIKLVALATISEAARVEALMNLGVPLHDTKIKMNHEDCDLALVEKVSIERVRIITQWGDEWPDFAAQATQIGVTGLHSLISDNEDDLHSIQATMAGMLMGLWTAFESQSQDAWVLAVNAYPKPLADRVLKTLDKEDQQKFLPGKMISDAGYDLRNCMGDILLRKRAVDFQMLDTIRQAYNVAFDNEFKAIFDEHFEKLSELEAMRNCFAHKGGVADGRFINRTRKVQGLHGIEKGDLVVVSGPYVAAMAKTVSSCVTKLITALDNWLMSQAPNDADGGS